MNLDISRLPVLQGVVAFLLIAMAVGFAGAFMATSDDGEELPPNGGNGEPTATPADGGTPPPANGDTFDVSMGDNFFEPDEFTVSAGSTITFNLTNDGVAIHNMRISGEDNEYTTGDDAVSDPDVVSGGQTATLTWTAPDSPGEIPFRCDFHPVDMVGTITVQ